MMVMSDANWNLSLEGKCQLGRTDACYRNLAPEGYTLHSSTLKPVLSFAHTWWWGRERSEPDLSMALSNSFWI